MCDGGCIRTETEAVTVCTFDRTRARSRADLPALPNEVDSATWEAARASIQGGSGTAARSVAQWRGLALEGPGYPEPPGAPWGGAGAELGRWGRAGTS